MEEFFSSVNENESPTKDEVDYFLNKKRPIIFYLITKPALLSDVRPKDLEQMHAYKEYLLQNEHTFREVAKDEDIEKYIHQDLTYNVKHIIQENAIINSKNQESFKYSDEQWFKNSIKEAIEKHLIDKGFDGLQYRREITFSENCLLWEGQIEGFTRVHLDIAKRAREEAFDIKYGNYNYEKDLRSRYPKEWYDPISQVIDKNFSKETEFFIIGVASNDGTELKEIFNNCSLKPKISVLDFSTSAINKGKRQYPEYTFYQGNMEGSVLQKNSYDLYLNLRSIHSSGVDIRQTLAECMRLLKPGGICIISVSDGYLIQDAEGDLKEKRGIYDNRSEAFIREKSNEIAQKIYKKMLDFGFEEVEHHTGKAEIFIIGKHPR